MGDGETKKKRPGWVWAISIFFFFSAGWTLLSFYLIYTGTVSLNPAQQAYFNNLTILDYSLTILMGFANLVGAISLFLLRKVALYLFVTALFANLLMTVWHIVFKGWAVAIGAPGLLGAIIGLGILVAVCFYSWRLTKSGVLT